MKLPRATHPIYTSNRSSTFEHDWRIRLRVDGVLHVLRHPPPHLRDAFVTRIKVLSRMDIAERRVPQDGRLRLTLPGGQNGDYRVNLLPTLFGEKLVLLRLDALPSDLSLGALGFDEMQSRTVESAIRDPRSARSRAGDRSDRQRQDAVALLLFADAQRAVAQCLLGRGSGGDLACRHHNQVSVREKAGLNFAVALRAFMR